MAKPPKLNLKREQLTTAGIRLRSILVFIDVLYFALGCGIMGIGIRIFVEKDNFLAIFGFGFMSSAASAIIIIGSLIVLVAVCGIAAVIIRNKCLMLIHIFAVVIILMMTIIGGCLAIIYRTQLSEKVRIEMIYSLSNTYGVETHLRNNAHITEVWDKLQRKHYCCGVEDNGWRRYQSSRWYHSQIGIPGVDKPYIPDSCCVYHHQGDYLDLPRCTKWQLGPPAKQGGQENDALHYRGCFEASGRLGLVWFLYVAGVSFACALILIVGLVLSVIFYRQLGK